MEIHVIRHTPVALGKDTCYGQSDVPLADSFSQNVENFKNQLPNDFDVVFSSPLQRCKSLATALQHDDIVLDAALMEMNFGNWENKKWNDIDQDELNAWMSDFVNIQTPEGENLLQLFERVSIFFDKLRHQPYKKVLIVTHAGVIRCLWAYILAIPLHNIFKITIGHNEVFICKLTDNSLMDSIRKI